ncbi:hypothetical protein C1645_75164 [Glomus cerebriforme]|uniref:Uncharacterized protein n=1 Tax=Glomus cerebriforme TaxID=658196 RepID=A0A397TNY1_9GLOM|nr:hypothetical protein C1645_75164 [Glomus cerebriforme]
MAPHSRDGGWRFIRFAPEKNIADNERVIERVWKSIQNAVSQDMLENRQPIIRENWKRRHSIQSPDAQTLPQTPLFGSASSSISPNIFWNNNNYNNNTQLVSPSISSSESFALLKERRPSEEQIRDQNTKVYERKSPDQIGSSRPNMKPKDFRPSQAFDPPVQEKKSPDQRVPIRPFIDTTCPPLDNSMVSPKNRSEKRSSDVRYSPSDKEEDPMEISVEIMQPEPSPKTSPTLDRDHSLPKSDAFLKDSGNDIINRSSKLLEQSDEEESNDEPVYESNNEMLSDDDLSRKEHHRISISLDTAAIVNYESSRNLSEQYSNHQRFEHESNFEKGKLETQSLISKGQNNSQDHSDYWANFEEDEEDDEENEKRKEKEDCNRNRNSIEENNPPIQVKRNLPSLKQNQLPTSEQSQFNQNIQDAQTFQQQKQVNSLEDNQPIKQIQPRSSLEQDNRLIPERSQNILTENGNIFSNSQFQSQNKNQTIAKSSQKKTPENQGMSFHPNVSSQKILVSQLKNRSEPLLSQNNTQVLIQENRKISYNDVQHASTQIKSPISRDQIQENSIPTTSSLQRYQMSDNRFDSTQMHVPNRPVQSQLSLQSTNQITQLISQTQDMPPIPSKRKIISQDNLSESQQNIMLSQSQLSERQRPRQESRSTITPQLSRRQTISDSRSIVASQPQQIHTPHSVPIQMRAPLQENRLMNPPQTQTQLMDSQSIFQSQVSTQETRLQVQQTLLEYQQISDGQYIDKQRDLNMEQERFNHNNPNFQQAIKPVPRRHTLSGANNSLYQQNFTDPYHHQRQFSTMVSSYPPPRQEILSSSIPFTSQPMSSPQHSLPLHSPILSQIPEEYSRNDPANVKIINFTSQKPSETTQQNVTNSSVPPVLRPTPQKRKSKGALDFILNTSGGSNLKRSKYDDEDNDVN